VKSAALERPIGLTPREIKVRLERRARRAGVPISSKLTCGLAAYLELLARWNRKINLTSLPLTEPTDETFDRLLIEPVIAARYLPAPNCSVIDIGSGGGSPAIPLKLAAPGISLRMVESKTRKAAFLREAVRQLNLTAVDVETARFEELLARPTMHEAHDVATLRAVRVEARTLKTVQAFLTSDGRIFLFQSSASDSDLPTIVPPLTWEASYPLVESFGSRLVVLRRQNFSVVAIPARP
jgi:16S rRNA (guanine527-N7)-methyltransferase